MAKSMAVSSSSSLSSCFLCLCSCTEIYQKGVFNPPRTINHQLIKSVKHQPTGLVATQIKSLKPLLSNGVRHKTQELLRRGLSEFQPVCMENNLCCTEFCASALSIRSRFSPPQFLALQDSSDSSLYCKRFELSVAVWKPQRKSGFKRTSLFMSSSDPAFSGPTLQHLQPQV